MTPDLRQELRHERIMFLMRQMKAEAAGYQAEAADCQCHIEAIERRLEMLDAVEGAR